MSVAQLTAFRFSASNAWRAIIAWIVGLLKRHGLWRAESKIVKQDTPTVLSATDLSASSNSLSVAETKVATVTLTQPAAERAQPALGAVRLVRPLKITPIDVASMVALATGARYQALSQYDLGLLMTQGHHAGTNYMRDPQGNIIYDPQGNPITQ